jgi:hypothetical protein
MVGMMRRVIYLAMLFPILLLTLCGVQAQNGDSESDSCRKFVQEFYDWYLKTPEANRDGMVVDKHGDLFDPELLALLKTNQAYEPPELELAFDASYFTPRQENADSYIAGPPIRRGSTYRIPVYGIREGIKLSEPELWAEVQRTKGGWQFVNFHDVIDGKPFNLVRELQQLQVDRARTKKR